ncbi:hypothetical protein TSUD_16860 [Trifolium subterraneum]|uniref:Uncharacterized protein n=1 Tax=Trifolium subterraneum TaxID=3900 RepID=A0A2Z6M482_TRISU|nr:hypothetical protein TSUD_16860 [Trifolium subterraneum]
MSSSVYALQILLLLLFVVTTTTTTKIGQGEVSVPPASSASSVNNNNNRSINNTGGSGGYFNPTHTPYHHTIMALKLNISLSLLLLLHITTHITSTIARSLPPPPADDSFNSQPPKISNPLISFDNKTNISPPHKSSTPIWGVLGFVLGLANFGGFYTLPPTVWQLFGFCSV